MFLKTLEINSMQAKFMGSFKQGHQKTIKNKCFLEQDTQLTESLTLSLEDLIVKQHILEKEVENMVSAMSMNIQYMSQDKSITVKNVSSKTKEKILRRMGQGLSLNLPRHTLVDEKSFIETKNSQR